MIIDVQTALKKLKDDEIVALPTETVYGLAANIYSKKALENIFITKKRPFFDPLIVHVSSIDMAQKISKDWNALDIFLAQKFWPGPLTLIKKKNSHISDLITASLPSVGMRMPNHPLMLKIIDELQIPLAAPSANKFKATSPTCAQHVEEEFAGLISVVDGGPCCVGIESTILETQGEESIHIYRPGVITPEIIHQSLLHTPWKNISIIYAQSDVAPGQLKEHYRPKKPITLFLTPSHFINPKGEHVIAALPEDVTLAARSLYSSIRNADSLRDNTTHLHLYFSKTLWVDTSWYPIRERLEKACTKIVDISNQ